jgi:hypothetical protein
LIAGARKLKPQDWRVQPIGPKRPSYSIAMATSILRQFLMPRVRMPVSFSTVKATFSPRRNFSSTPTPFATYNQVVKAGLPNDALPDSANNCLRGVGNSNALEKLSLQLYGMSMPRSSRVSASKSVLRSPRNLIPQNGKPQECG